VLNGISLRADSPPESAKLQPVHGFAADSLQTHNIKFFIQFMLT
jgi:hypothetical protein